MRLLKHGQRAARGGSAGHYPTLRYRVGMFAVYIIALAALAERVYVMRNGELRQRGTPSKENACEIISPLALSSSIFHLRRLFHTQVTCGAKLLLLIWLAPKTPRA